MAAITVFGIKTCDTVRKARDWLDAEGVDNQLHDFRVDGLDRKRLEGWVDAAGWETLLNKSSTTFRALSDDEKQGLDRDKAIELMLAHPTMIKRPVVKLGRKLLVGFKPAVYAEALAKSR